MEIYFLVARASRPLQSMFGYFRFSAIFAFPALAGGFASLLFEKVILVDPGRIDQEPSFLLASNGARVPGTAQCVKNGSAWASSGL